MAELLFKRGLHANLPTTAKDGAFYLTTDTHRLYAGVGTQLVDLNQYINVVDSLDDANKLTGLKEGDFVYLKKGNILAIVQADSEGNLKYIQINTQATLIKNSAFNITGNAADNSITLGVKDSAGNTVSKSFKVLGNQGANVSVDASGNITVDGVVYTVGGTIDATNGTYTVALSPDEAHKTVASSDFTLTAGNNVTFSGTDENLIISSKNTVLDPNGTFTVNGADATVKIKDTDGNTATASVTNGFFYKVGKNGTTLVGNQGNLSVYTIEEIDAIVRGLNAMVYKGPVDSASNLQALTNVQAGDTYMVRESLNLEDLGVAEADRLGVTTAKRGDLLIATGTEGSDGYLTNIVWTYIPSGDDSQTDTTYVGAASIADHKLTLKDSNGSVVASIQLVNTDGKITLASVAALDGKGIQTTLTHAAPGQADATKQSTAEASVTLDSNKTVDVVSDVTVDATGHVSKVQKTPVKLPTYALAGANVALAENVVTVTDTLTCSNGDKAGTSIFKLAANKDDSLKIAVNDNQITMSLEWEEF